MTDIVLPNVPQQQPEKTMDSIVQEWNGHHVMIVAESGEPIGLSAATDLVGEAAFGGINVVAIPCARLDPAFFNLRSGLAGEIAQKFTTYRVRLVLLGDIPESAASSQALAAYVRESNRGNHLWFVPTVDALRERLIHS